MDGHRDEAPAHATTVANTSFQRVQARNRVNSLHQSFHSEDATKPRKDSLVYNDEETGEELRFEKDPKRWIALAMFCSVAGSSSFQWLAFGPIVKEAKTYYSMTSGEVNTIALVFMAVYPPCVPIAFYTFENSGFRTALFIAAVLNAIGALTKFAFVYVWPTFAGIVVSTIFAGTSAVFYGSMSAFMSALWFPAEERTLATSLAIASNNVGSALAFLIPPMVVTKDDHGEAAFGRYFAVQAAIMSAIPILIMVFLPVKPKHPPSATANTFATAGSMSTVVANVKTLFCTPNFLLVAAITALNGTVLWTVGPLLAQFLSPYGIDEKSAGRLGFIGTLVGTASGPAVGFLVDRTRQYKAILLSINLIICVTMGAYVAAVPHVANVSALAYCLFVLVFVFLASTVAIGFEFCVEVSFPAPEAVSCGVTMFFLTMFSSAIMPVASAVLGNTSTKASAGWGVTVFIVMEVLAALLLLVTKEDKRRQQVESGGPEAVAVNEHQPLLK